MATVLLDRETALLYHHPCYLRQCKEEEKAVARLVDLSALRPVDQERVFQEVRDYLDLAQMSQRLPGGFFQMHSFSDRCLPFSIVVENPAASSFTPGMLLSAKRPLLGIPAPWLTEGMCDIRLQLLAGSATVEQAISSAREAIAKTAEKADKAGADVRGMLLQTRDRDLRLLLECKARPRETDPIPFAAGETVASMARRPPAWAETVADYGKQCADAVQESTRNMIRAEAVGVHTRCGFYSRADGRLVYGVGVRSNYDIALRSFVDIWIMQAGSPACALHLPARVSSEIGVRTAVPYSGSRNVAELGGRGDVLLDLLYVPPPAAAVAVACHAAHRPL